MKVYFDNWQRFRYFAFPKDKKTHRYKQNENNEKLLNDVLTYKRKEKLYLRRDEILKRLEENISKDEQEILQLELNQIIIEISKLKL